MRSDMQKVIVERPRFAHAARSRKTGRKLDPRAIHDDFDSGATRAPAHRHEKSFNEHLNPFRRYLESQVGRPWNKVYSEIRKTIDLRNTIGLHVMQHLEDFVDRTTEIRDGQVVAFSRWGGAPHPPRRLYVDPRTGILRRAKKRPDQAQKLEIAGVRVSDRLYYEKREGIWFRFEAANHDPQEIYAYSDSGRWKKLPPGTPTLELPDGRRAVRWGDLPERSQLGSWQKRQANKRQIAEIEQRIQKKQGIYAHSPRPSTLRRIR